MGIWVWKHPYSAAHQQWPINWAILRNFFRSSQLETKMEGLFELAWEQIDWGKSTRSIEKMRLLIVYYARKSATLPSCKLLSGYTLWENCHRKSFSRSGIMLSRKLERNTKLNNILFSKNQFVLNLPKRIKIDPHFARNIVNAWIVSVWE